MSEASANPRTPYRGDLAQTPLPEVLATIHRYRVPGVIDCHRESDTKSIYVDSGNIIFATSSDVHDSLGDRLLGQGLITHEQYDESVRRLNIAGNKRQGTILVEMGAIAPKDLFVAVRSQVQTIVRSLFEWREGAVFFEPGRERTQEFIKLDIPTPQAILEGVRNVQDARSFIARIGTKATILQRSTDSDIPQLTLTPEEKNLLDAVDGKRSLFDLTNLDGMTPSLNGRVLYALFALKLITVKPLKQLKLHLRVKSDQG